MATRSVPSALGFALIRVVTGLFLALLHGWGKVVHAYQYLVHGQEWHFIQDVADIGFPMPVLFALLSALAEFVGGWLIALGLWTRYAAFFVLFNMLVAVYRNLSQGSFDKLASLYAVVALACLISGGGAFSLDARLRKAG